MGSRPEASGSRRAAREADECERAKQVMLRLLSVRMRSRWELERRLAQRRFSPEAVSEALDDLERVGLVNDREFARLFLESRVRTRARSYRVLAKELRSRGLADELVRDAVEEQRRELSEEDLAVRALKQRLKGVKGLPAGQAKGRLARFLVGRGFAHSLIEEVLQDI